MGSRGPLGGLTGLVGEDSYTERCHVHWCQATQGPQLVAVWAFWVALPGLLEELIRSSAAWLMKVKAWPPTAPASEAVGATLGFPAQWQ